MATEHTLFDLPNNPEEIDVLLPPSDLRKINFSALEFSTLRRALIEYIKTYYPDQFNDFVANNGIIMILELVSYVGGILSTRSDVLADESFLPTAQSEIAVANHLALINQGINRQTPATVEVEITVRTPTSTEIRIPAAYTLSIPGPDGRSIIYELYRAPNDYASYISILPSKRGVVAWGIEGKFSDPVTYVSTGGLNQIIEIPDDNTLLDPIEFKVITGTTEKLWKKVDIIEQAKADDEVFEARIGDKKIILVTGDNVAGKALTAGQSVQIRYRQGGGIRGRIGSNTLSRSDFISPQAPATAPVEVLFRNPNPSNGGTDKETLSQSKIRAPKEASTLGKAVSGEDYAILAQGYSHPSYGTVSKAVATLRTSLNANLVELYVLAIGPNDVPVVPSVGMKNGLIQYFDSLKVLTDEVRIYDGAIKAITIDANIIVDRNVNPSIVKTYVENAIRGFFDVSKFNMGVGFYLSNLYETLQKIDGVKFITIITPEDDILPSSKIAGQDEKGVGYNELITLGETNLRFFQE